MFDRNIFVSIRKKGSKYWWEMPFGSFFILLKTKETDESI